MAAQRTYLAISTGVCMAIRWMPPPKLQWIQWRIGCKATLTAR